MGTLSIWHWLIVLLVVAAVFGTKKLRNMGEDLGAAVKGFKEGMKQDGAQDDDAKIRIQVEPAAAKIEKPLENKSEKSS